MLFRISWRNIWRNKARTFVIVTAILLGLWGGIFSTAFMNGMSEQQVYSSIHTETGHLQLNAPGFLLNYDVLQMITDADSIVAAMQRDPAVAAVAPRIMLSAVASTAGTSTGVMINGVDIVSQNKVSELYRSVVKGTYLEDRRNNSIVVGRQLAEKLHVSLHSRIVMTLQTTVGDITYAAFTVTGIYRTHNSDFDKSEVFVRRKDLQSIISFPQNAASIITVLLRKTSDTREMAGRLRKEYPELQVQDWRQLSPMMQVMSGTVRQFSLIFVAIILIALAFGIVNTMLMAVLDRTREIGMLLSIGMSPSRIFRMILLETVLLSLTGATGGVLLSILSILYFHHTGIDLSRLGEGINALGYATMVYPSLGFGFYIELAALVVIIALIAGLFPALRAIRMNPAEAVRGE